MAPGALALLPGRALLTVLFHHYILHYKMIGKAIPAGDDAGQTQLLKGLADLALLSLLDERAHYGLQILGRLQDEAGLDLAEGTIYPLLHRLERAGHTRSEWVLDEGASRPRKYYSITPAGQRQLARLAREWRQLSTSLARFLERTHSP